MDNKKRAFILGGFVIGIASSIGYTIYSMVKKDEEDTDILEEDIEEGTDK